MLVAVKIAIYLIDRETAPGQKEQLEQLPPKEKACGLTCSPLANSGIQLLAPDGATKGAPERRNSLARSTFCHEGEARRAKETLYDLLHSSSLDEPRSSIIRKVSMGVLM